MTTQPLDLKKLREVVSEMYESHRPSDSTVGRWASVIEEAADAYEARASDADETLWNGYLFLMHNVPFLGKEESIAAFRREMDSTRHATQGD